mgnify:CR=1 FL=1
MGPFTASPPGHGRPAGKGMRDIPALRRPPSSVRRAARSAEPNGSRACTARPHGPACADGPRKGRRPAPGCVSRRGLPVDGARARALPPDPLSGRGAQVPGSAGLTLRKPSLHRLRPGLRRRRNRRSRSEGLRQMPQSTPNLEHPSAPRRHFQSFRRTNRPQGSRRDSRSQAAPASPSTQREFAPFQFFLEIRLLPPRNPLKSTFRIYATSGRVMPESWPFLRFGGPAAAKRSGEWRRMRLTTLRALRSKGRD